MGHSDSGEPRDRVIAAYGPTNGGLIDDLRRHAGPAVVATRRAVTRFVPLLRRSGPAHALQGSLLERIDVSGYNLAGPPSLDDLQSQVVSAAQIAEPLYREWAARIGEEPRFHRKQWEYIVILLAAEQAGLLRPGASAIGFGVGTEPVPAAFAARGVRVVATDRPQDERGHWSTRNEYAVNVESLVKPAICDPSVMREVVSFRPVDMAALPEDLGRFDIVWSACALEHLGSPAVGLDFALRSLELLKPGGIAIHTTEFDLTPGPHAVDYGHCALYRLQDLNDFAARVRSRGFQIDINPYVAFEHPADRAIAPPLSLGDEQFHLKLALYDSISTSIVLVIRHPTD